MEANANTSNCRRSHAMAGKLTIWTYDWVPAGPRGFVRDLRLRWAAEEAGLAHDVRTVPFEDHETNHLDRQPFGQMPFLDVDDVRIFESGACLPHLARKSEVLMTRDAPAAAETLQWVVAALNSIEMVVVPWWFLTLSGPVDNGLARSEEHTSELQSLMRISYAVFCLKKKNTYI